jgi:putative peptidoglycan lipid II flippase
MIVLIDTRLASGAGEGSLAMMRFATRLQQFPLGVVVAAVTLATLPLLARAAPERFADLPHSTEFRRLLGLTGRYLLLLIVPVTILMIGLSEPIIRVVFLRGEFVEANVPPTALALLIYSLQLPLVALDQLFIFAYYSARNTRTPVLVGLIAGFVYLAIAIPSVGPAGFHGLVWANTAQNSFHAVVLGLLLWRAVGTVSLRPIFGFGLKLAGAAGIMIGTMLVLSEILDSTGYLSDFPMLVLVAVGSLAVYLAATRAFRIREARDLTHRLRPLFARYFPGGG